MPSYRKTLEDKAFDLSRAVDSLFESLLAELNAKDEEIEALGNENARLVDKIDDLEQRLIDGS